jgi:glutamate/tyrosine decarboxylase-like PLP-dependent enzyme
VDAAYGGFATLADPGLLSGLEQADSLTLDPHKWLYQPFECGCVLVRDGRALPRAFEMHPEYLLDARTTEGEVNFSDLGLQLTPLGAGAEALGLAAPTSGSDAFREAIRRSLEVAAAAARRIEQSEDARDDGSAVARRLSASAAGTSTTRPTRASRPRWSGAAPA